MSWVSDFINGEIITHTKLNAIIDGLKNWGGNVNAGGYNLSNVGSITFSGGGYAGSLAYRADLAITANKQVTMADLLPVVTTPAEGSRVTVVAQQDGTGGWVVSWSADFHGVESHTGAAGLTSIWQFEARADGDWWLVGQPVLEIS